MDNIPLTTAELILTQLAALDRIEDDLEDLRHMAGVEIEDVLADIGRKRAQCLDALNASELQN